MFMHSYYNLLIQFIIILRVNFSLISIHFLQTNLPIHFLVSVKFNKNTHYIFLS
jgi:hypothetical protein